MKVQCVHEETGLCKTCWDYEVENARLKEDYELLKTVKRRYQKKCGDLTAKLWKTQARIKELEKPL